MCVWSVRTSTWACLPVSGEDAGCPALSALTSVAVMNTMTSRKLGRKGLTSSYRLQIILAGSRARNLEQKSWRLLAGPL